ncbi:2-C-methyl-D-erythritol 4-phosphate cytidylyltransferase [Kineosporia sp. J2-2]|uniref:2-C-methyl-D-erythritol 4-phosphate cytidylyltransferase n=1 Tax=Kineosporia corallincola TaxID=2835133 RepID=A0ABS5TNL9_9ACTN|nr:2-C-methyl-D-erythritol 4-phosphate cytidylyltransferase [Kineosporia corallincola]MBT0772697.1 2-C-methyl-D-erythritol 4-phosphate cytidylyltransferase [Kineosporia corallincola]
MSVWGVVLAGGGGTRFGGLKQFAVLGGQTLLERVVDIAAANCDGVVVVLPAGHEWPGQGVRATGGATRAESVRSGLAALPDDAGIVCITDAAHPLATAVLYERVVQAVRAGADAALPGLPLTDAVKQLEDDEEPAPPTAKIAAPGPGPRILGLAGATTPAGGHVSAQMPMAFSVPVLRRAHEEIADAVEDSAMVAALGGRVVVVPGEPTNVHVTTPAELAVAHALLPLL